MESIIDCKGEMETIDDRKIIGVIHRLFDKQQSQKRWKIEEYHKSIKSISGLEKSPTRTVRTQNNHIFSTICAYVKPEMLSFNQHLNHFALKYKLIVNANRLPFYPTTAYEENYGFCVTPAYKLAFKILMLIYSLSKSLL